MIKINDINDKIKQRGLKKTFVMEQLGLSRGTFYARLKEKEFKHNEVTILKQLGLA
jgi:DNA-binding NtrC family response regulator